MRTDRELVEAGKFKEGEIIKKREIVGFGNVFIKKGKPYQYAYFKKTPEEKQIIKQIKLNKECKEFCDNYPLGEKIGFYVWSGMISEEDV